jgi:hypothetical protein
MTGVEMPCTNRDASLLTKKRRGVAEYSYYNDWRANTVNNNTGFNNQAVIAPARISAEVIGEIKVGCMAAYAYNNNLVRQGNTAFSAAVGFPGAQVDNNVKLYPNNYSAGGAHGLTGTS